MLMVAFYKVEMCACLMKHFHFYESLECSLQEENILDFYLLLKSSLHSYGKHYICIPLHML